MFFYVAMKFIYLLSFSTFLSASDAASSFFKECQNLIKEKTIDIHVFRQKVGEVDFKCDAVNNIVEIKMRGIFCQIHPVSLDEKIFDLRRDITDKNMYIEGHFPAAPRYTFLYRTSIKDENRICFLPSLRYRYFLQECLTFVDVLTRNIHDFLLQYPDKQMPLYSEYTRTLELSEPVKSASEKLDKSLFVEDSLPNPPPPSLDISNDDVAGVDVPEKTRRPKLIYNHDDFPFLVDDNSPLITEPEIIERRRVRATKYSSKSHKKRSHKSGRR